MKLQVPNYKFYSQFQFPSQVINGKVFKWSKVFLNFIRIYFNKKLITFESLTRNSICWLKQWLKVSKSNILILNLMNIFGDVQPQVQSIEGIFSKNCARLRQYFIYPKVFEGNCNLCSWVSWANEATSWVNEASTITARKMKFSINSLNAKVAFT